MASLSASRACPALRRGPPIPAIPSANAPAPRPSSKRPPLSTSRVAACLASMAGGRSGRLARGEQVHGLVLAASQVIRVSVSVKSALYPPGCRPVRGPGVCDGGDPLGDRQAAGIRSTLSPNFRAASVVLLVWRSAPVTPVTRAAAPQPARAASRNSRMVARAPARRCAARAFRPGDGDQHAAPVVGGASARQPAALPEAATARLSEGWVSGIAAFSSARRSPGAGA